MRTKWLLIAAPLLLLAGLAQSAFWVPTYESQANRNPERLVTYLQANIGDCKILNPILAADEGSLDVLHNRISEALVDADENLKLVPRLAERWETTENAYLAVLPDRQLPDGSPVTGQGLRSALELAWKAGQLPGLEHVIQRVELVPAETRELTETVLVDNEQGKKEPIEVALTVAVPERVKLQLAEVDPRLFDELTMVVGKSYFEGYPFGDRFRLKRPELLPRIRDRFPELLGVGEHNPVLTFHVRPGVRWHDGVPLDAEDVKFTYEAAIDPKNASPRASYFEAIKSVEVLNALTARVTYKRLYGPAVIGWMLDLIPKHLLDAAALAREMNRRGLTGEARRAFSVRSSEYNRSPIGTGPYRFAEWRPDQFVRLVRNDTYWGEKPEYERLYYRVISDFLSMELEFQAGALDRYNALPHQADRYRHDPKYQVVARNEGYYSFIGYNLRRPLFQDVRVRRALGMAIDVDSIIKYVLYGQGKRATGPYFSNTPYADLDLKPLPYDPRAALSLLAEAGWHKNRTGVLEKDGKVLQFTLTTNSANPERNAIMAIAQEAWRQLGVDCKIQALEWAVFIGDLQSDQFDAVVLAWGGGDINPDKYEVWHSSQTHPYESNYVGYQSARADALIERIRIEYDPAQVVQLTQELHRLIAADQPYTFLYEPTRAVVLDRRIARIVRTPDGREQIEKIATTRSGEIDHFFPQWRKLSQAPVYPAE